MSKQVYVLKASLVGFGGIHRTIAVRSDQTLVDVHHALQAAFDWVTTTCTRSGWTASSGLATVASTTILSMPRSRTRSVPSLKDRRQEARTSVSAD